MSANNLKPEEKVRIAINMTNVVTQVCADGVRQHNSKMTEKELISTLRRRFSLTDWREKPDRSQDRTYHQSAESLLLAKLRTIKTTIQPERAAIDKQDIRAILQSTDVSLKALRRKAGAQGTLELLDELIRD